jgi:hypothetical protein
VYEKASKAFAFIGASQSLLVIFILHVTIRKTQTCRGVQKGVHRDNRTRE